MNISILNENSVDDNKGGTPVYIESVFQAIDLYDLAAIVMLNHIAIGVFNNNYRKGVNWKSCDFIAIDFDDGSLTADEVNKQLTMENLNHAIVGSKNHLKDKGDGKGIIERFHVFIPFDASIINDGQLYSFVYERFMKYMKWNCADNGASKDKCRYYFKHSDCIHIFEDGENLSLEYYIELKKRKEIIVAEMESEHKKRIAKYDNDLPIVKFKRTRFYTMLKNEMNVDGNRYHLSNRIIPAMINCGVELSDAIQLFEEFSSYGKSFTRESIETRYNKWR